MYWTLEYHPLPTAVMTIACNNLQSLRPHQMLLISQKAVMSLAAELFSPILHILVHLVSWFFVCALLYARVKWQDHELLREECVLLIPCGVKSSTLRADMAYIILRAYNQGSRDYV